MHSTRLPADKSESRKAGTKEDEKSRSDIDSLQRELNRSSKFAASIFHANLQDKLMSFGAQGDDKADDNNNAEEDIISIGSIMEDQQLFSEL